MTGPDTIDPELPGEQLAVVRARHLLDVSRYDEALRQLSVHLATSPDDEEALCLMALCHLRRGDHRAALQAAGAAVRVAPDNEWPHRIASIALERLGNGAAAVTAAEEAVRLAPDRWETHCQHASALLATHRRRAAYDSARRAVELGPFAAEAHLTLGLAADARGRRREERAAYERALELDPDNAAALNNLAAMDINRGRLGSGARTLMAALRRSPQDGVLRDNVDAIAVRLVARLLTAMLIGGVGLVVVFFLEDAGELPTWWPRASLAVVLLGLYAWIAWATLRHLPSGARHHLRGLPRRLTGGRRFFAVFFVLVSAALLGVAFLPGDAAAVAAVLLIVAIRVSQVIFVVWLVMWVIRRFRR